MRAAPVPVRHSTALLEHLARQSRRGAEDALAPLGLRPRHLVALTLLREGPATQQGLGDALSIDASNLVGLLNELEDAGLAARRRDPEDRRRHIVELTTRGTTTLAAAERALTAVEDDVLGSLAPEERAQLHDLLLRASGGHLPTCTEAVTDC